MGSRRKTRGGEEVVEGGEALSPFDGAAVAGDGPGAIDPRYPPRHLRMARARTTRYSWTDWSARTRKRGTPPPVVIVARAQFWGVGVRMPIVSLPRRARLPTQIRQLHHTTQHMSHNKSLGKYKKKMSVIRSLTIPPYSYVV